MKKYHRESIGGLLGHGFMDDVKYLFWPAIRDGSAAFPFVLVGILACHYYLFGTVLPPKEDYATKNIINQEQIFIPDSTYRDSLPDSIFIPKPEPLEDRLK